MAILLSLVRGTENIYLIHIIFFLQNWDGIYIESDNTKYNDILSTFENNERIKCINSMVGYEENNSLDNIIDNIDYTNKNFDIISIDVDG